MVNVKTYKQFKIMKNKKSRKRTKSRSKHRRVKGGESTNQTKDTKQLIKLDVYITPAKDGVSKRKIDFDVDTFYDFYDYLNEVDMFLKNTLNEELLAFTDPKRYDTWKKDNKDNTIKKSYEVKLEKDKK